MYDFFIYFTQPDSDKYYMKTEGEIGPRNSTQPSSWETK